MRTNEVTAAGFCSRGPLATRRIELLNRVGWGAWLVVLWLGLLALPATLPLGFEAWYTLLAHDWREGLQAGTDFVFTYGPLGWLLRPALGFEADLFGTKVFAASAVALGMALVLTAFLRQLPTVTERLLAALLVIYLVPMIPEGHLLLTIVAGAARVVYRPVSPWFGGLVCLLLAAFGLVKFTYFVLSVPCVAAMVGVCWLRGSRRAAAGFAGGYLAAFLCCWLIAGQSLDGIPTWLRMSAEIASGYNDTMGLAGSEWQFGLGLACVLLVCSACASTVIARPRSLAQAALLLVFLPAVFVAWKGGFVRHDDAHCLLFFAFATFAPLVLLPAIAGKARHRHWLRVLCLVTIVPAVIGMQHADPVRGLPYFVQALRMHFTELAQALLGLGHYAERQQETWNQYAAELAMPETRRLLGNGTIDSFGHQQGVLFANGLRVHHRPVFHTYSAYTGLLQEANAACYEKQDGPDCVLYKNEPLDDYFPTVQDSQAVLALLAGYRPVLVEREYLLLKRRPERRTRAMVPRQTVLERRVRMGEWVEIAGVPGDLRLLSLDAGYSLRGRVRGFLLRPPCLFLEVKLADQSVCSFRIAPAIVRVPFLLDPLLLTTQDYLALYGHPEMLMRVGAFRVRPPEGKESGFAETVGVHLLACDGLKPALGDLPAAEFEGLDRPFWPMFRVAPFHVTCGSRVGAVVVDGQKVLFAHAPSELRFHLGPGQHVVSGAFGILPDAWTGEGKTNGVAFHVVRETGSERVEVFHRLLQPLEKQDDRGTQRFSVTVDVPADSVLVLATDCGPAGRPNFDWSYWTDVGIEPR